MNVTSATNPHLHVPPLSIPPPLGGGGDSGRDGERDADASLLSDYRSRRKESVCMTGMNAEIVALKQEVQLKNDIMNNMKRDHQSQSDL